jgi:hypothetical protein
MQAYGERLAEEVRSVVDKLRNSQMTAVAVLLTCMLLTGLGIILMSYGSTRTKRQIVETNHYSRDRIEYSIISTDFDDNDDEDDLDLPILKQNNA